MGNMQNCTCNDISKCFIMDVSKITIMCSNKSIIIDYDLFIKMLSRRNISFIATVYNIRVIPDKIIAR